MENKLTDPKHDLERLAHTERESMTNKPLWQAWRNMPVGYRQAADDLESSAKRVRKRIRALIGVHSRTSDAVKRDAVLDILREEGLGE